ncbi:MAG: glycoside hydrolase family 95 protein [Lachnospiraceae bacterium]|nr:glycoside hydrolase family 95 protein [Lachnospiraceae bacterium]
MKKQLWFDKWTEEYMEGLPVGNGRLAAMMLGRPEKLRIALNHEWMWRGENRFREMEDVSAHLEEVRKALLEEDFLKGTELANKYFGGNGGISGIQHRVDPYEPVGDVWIEMDAGEAGGYTRRLDLETGLAETVFTAPCGQVSQRLFVSCTDGCVTVDVTAENSCDMAVILSRIEDPRCEIGYEACADGVCMSGAFLDGISFKAKLLINTDGTWILEKNRISVKGATKLLLLIQAGTNAKGEAPEAEMTFPAEWDFELLLKRHADTFRTLKGDAVLDVDVEDCDLPTDQRIRLFREGGDPAMPLLYFEYGRYLMVSGSSGELPINLQGKWNEELQPPWEADYHLDINLEMCYWFVETLGMKHAANTLFNLIERYVPYGKVVAQKLYGCKGVTMCIQTDVWGRVTPEACGWAVWLGAAPWLGQHMFMHWRYTKDINFLKDRCYPFLKEAAAFFEDYLFEKDGMLWIAPSQSPENRFEGTGDWPVSIGVNSAMDVELITELMNSAAEAAEILGVDSDKVCLWRQIVSRLPELSTDSQGRLNEWDKERVEVEPGHRHFSHLYGLHPSQLFEPGSWEWKAAEKSLDSRLSNGGGHTGWSRSWVACMMARLGRGEEAWKHFMALIGDFATVSLLDLHPPRIFQIDGNMGGTACVCEMLMQSRRGTLYLLPALPKAWPDGSVKNFRAQDNVTVSYTWKNGVLTGFEVIAAEDQVLKVISGDSEWSLELKAGEAANVKM